MPAPRPAPQQGPEPQGLRQSSLREQNLALVTRLVFAGPGRLSRADVAARSGMTRSTVSRLVDDLVAGGVLTELAPLSGLRGRPAVPLAPAPGTMAALGVEVNVAHVALCLVDLAGHVLRETLVEGPLTGRPAGDVLAEVGALVRPLLASSDVPLVAAHLALPGLVDVASGRLLLAPNLGWRDVRPADVLGPVLPDGVSLTVGNEADYAARSVALRAPGAPGEATTFIYLSGESGIGAAFVRDGTVSGGSHGLAGEIGHVTVHPDGPRCGCGALGCLEAYAGQQAILRSAGAPDVTTLLDRLDEGEEAALASLRTAGWALGVALSDAVNLLDISTVIIGGHLAALVPHLEASLLAELNARVLAAEFARPVVRTARLDHLPAALGAAYAGLDEVISHPARLLAKQGENLARSALL